MLRHDDAVVVTCEHAGHRVPPRFAHVFRGQRALLASHRGYDRGAMSLATLLGERFECEAIVCPFTRLLIDTNRSEHHRSLYSSFTRKLPVADRQHLLERYYRVHRARVEAAIAAAAAKHRRVVHLAAHSFAPVLNGEVRNADIGLLYDPGRRAERELCRQVGRRLRQSEPVPRLRFNYPYRGSADGLTTALRREFREDGYLGVEIELNQAVLEDRRAARRLMARIADAFAAALGDQASVR